MRYSEKLICVFMIIITQSLTAQSDDQIEGWGIAEVSIKATKKISINVAEHVRYKNDFSVLDKYFTQVGFNYELFKNFKIGTKARFITENDSEGNVQGLESHFRYQAEINYKHDVGKLDLTYRLSYQNKNELGVSDIPNEYTRFRAGINYKIKPIKSLLKLEGELFNQIKKGNSDNGINLYRLTMKLSHKIKGNNEIGLFYRIQKDIDREEPVNRKIIGFKFTHKFDLTK